MTNVSILRASTSSSVYQLVTTFLLTELIVSNGEAYVIYGVKTNSKLGANSAILQIGCIMRKNKHANGNQTMILCSNLSGEV